MYQAFLLFVIFGKFGEASLIVNKLIFRNQLLLQKIFLVDDFPEKDSMFLGSIPKIGLIGLFQNLNLVPVVQNLFYFLSFYHFFHFLLVLFHPESFANIVRVQLGSVRRVFLRVFVARSEKRQIVLNLTSKEGVFLLYNPSILTVHDLPQFKVMVVTFVEFFEYGGPTLGLDLVF